MLEDKLEPQLSWLSQPDVFNIGREPAHSDHFYFDCEEDYLEFKDDGTCACIPLRQSLNGVWKFSYANKPADRVVDFYQEEYDCSKMDDIAVPGHIQLQGYDYCQYINTMYPWDGEEFLRPPMVSENYNPVGSYVTYFDVEERLRDKRIYLSFQGVETAMYVWLNGVFIGYGEDCFSPKDYDITDLVRDKNNKLAVEVYKRSSASWVEDQDFFRFSGIFREVFLYSVPDIHVRDLDVVATLDDTYENGVLTVKAEVSGRNKDLIYSVECELFDASNQIVSSWKEWPENAVIKNVLQWSAEIPNLYTLVCKIYDAYGNLIELVPQKIGFKRIEMKNKVMMINGKRLMIHGVNRHEFSYTAGRCLPYDKMAEDIKIMKKNHINAVRTSHYPNQSAWYRLCDEYGIYVLDEANLESHGSWQKMGAIEPSWNVPRNLPEWKENMLDRASSMYERDKNHASIIIWSCGNEAYAGEDILAMANYFRNKDKNRLVHYENCVRDRNYSDCTDMESRMYARPNEIAEYLRSNPEKPFISCEYMHVMGTSNGGLLQYSELEDEFEQYQGGFIWDFVDQALLVEDESGEKVIRYGGDFDDRATDYHFCANGLLFADRSEKPAMEEVKYLYQEVKMDMTKDFVILKNKYLFRDLSDCRLVVTVQNDREVFHTMQVEDITTNPGENREFALEFNLPDAVYEYVINACIYKKENTKGYDFGLIAREQLICRNEVNPEIVVELNAPEANSRKVSVIEGDVNLGVTVDDLRYYFSYTEGGMTSLKDHGREHIYRAPKISFWRALTDNDNGGKSGFDRAGWLPLGLLAKNVERTVCTDSKNPSIRYEYALAGVTDAKAYVSYEFDTNKDLIVTAEFTGTKELKEMPVFALDFMLKGEYQDFVYYGKGPRECYNDREEGAFLGLYKSNAKENFLPNVRPQECGNRTGVRYVKVMNKEQHGLMFSMVDAPFEMSVLPYSCYELENALHIDELPKSHYTWVRISAGQRGIGGDDSWGAPIRKQYELDATKSYCLKFRITTV